ncbi:hypothetical protein GJAV_G00234690 [Gymnothorax javanicus]|nr:hypothetical protein GJAV_G00234690 [Gymnothorax javanicus]
MCCLLLTVLLIAGALPIGTWGQTSYHALQGIYKEAADEAIRHLNQRVLQHMNFLGYLSNTERSDPFYIELHLKATTCKNTGQTTHQDDCQFKPKTPPFNCAVCKPDNDFRTHCVIEQNAIKFVDHRKKLCPKTHHTGEDNVFTSTIFSKTEEIIAV